jgi:hypothetical protein
VTESLVSGSWLKGDTLSALSASLQCWQTRQCASRIRSRWTVLFCPSDGRITKSIRLLRSCKAMCSKKATIQLKAYCKSRGRRSIPNAQPLEVSGRFWQGRRRVPEHNCLSVLLSIETLRILHVDHSHAHVYNGKLLAAKDRRLDVHEICLFWSSMSPTCAR